VSAVTGPLLGRPAADRACRRWVAAAVPDLSAVDGSRALGVGRGATTFTALLAARHQHVLAAGALADGVALVPGGAGGLSVRADRRGLLEVEPQLDGRFDLILAIDTIRRLDADDIVLPHVGWLLTLGGHLLALDPVSRLDWAAVRARYQALLPGARIDEVQPDVMGMRWQRCR
jgi:hypothetical protein